jgi:hypothetical protein
LNRRTGDLACLLFELRPDQLNLRVDFHCGEYRRADEQLQNMRNCAMLDLGNAWAADSCGLT